LGDLNYSARAVVIFDDKLLITPHESGISSERFSHA